MSILGKKWVLRYKRKPDETLWAALLEARTIGDPDTFFSNASLDDLHDPFLFSDMEKAVDRLQRAINRRERIVVYGDYDVDGLSGTALLIHTLRMLGAEVSYRVPHRREDGYGLHKKYIEELAVQKVSVLITVDLGISCKDEVAIAQKSGIDVIITDHHTLPQTLPEAFATLHPKLASTYPFNELSGSGVAFKLACALLQRTKNEDWIPHLTDLASLGTVADCVPLVGENRAIVKLGLAQMKNTRWEGLKAILKIAGSWEKEFTPQTIGFQIGPRLNASGRLESPYWGLQALLANAETALEKCEKLEELNRRRQDMMGKIIEEAEVAINPEDAILIAAGPWSSGIVGLVAGRLQEKYGKPVFILEDRGDSLVGSARSLPGFHCVEALQKVAPLLETFGGHEQAAGFHLKKENYEAFKATLLKHAQEVFEKTPLERKLNIDFTLKGEDLNLENCEKVADFAPFGVGNETPLFLLEEVEILSVHPVGKEEKHLKFEGKTDGKFFEGIGFQFGPFTENLHAAKQLVVHLEKNEWQDRTSLQLRLVDFSS
ncbi:MAG: single-stranded-DNA-specific exonuclease RecJ [Candidatus Gracilibacteria bacterium]